MAPFGERRGTRRVFDIGKASKRVFHDGTINLRVKFFKRYPLVTGLAGLALVTLAVLGVNRFFASAEVKDFYPASCLGTWQTPSNAQGEPESLAAGSDISATNSAQFSGDTAELFCGTFLPSDAEGKGNIQSVGLSLVWDIQGLPVASDTIQSSQSSNRFQPLASIFFKTAFADDASDAGVASSASDTTPLGPALTASLTPQTTTLVDEPSTTIISEPLPVVPPAPPVPDENFLLVSYSMDGNNWVPLQKVNAGNWKNLTISLPITTWDDLKKVQIKIEGIANTLSVAPLVLLDGSFMEVHYELPPLLLNNGITQNPDDVARVVAVNSNVTIEVPAKEPPSFVPPPNIVTLSKDGDTVHVTVQYVGEFYGNNPLYLYLYPAGTTAERNNADSAFTFAGQPSEGPAINPMPITSDLFDPVTKQATFTLVAPGASAAPDARGGDIIRSEDMLAGTYAVDISYFNNTTWALIVPQTFLWP